MRPVTRHGYGGYTLRCRCPVCVEAKRFYNRTWMQKWRRKQKRARWGV